MNQVSGVSRPFVKERALIRHWTHFQGLLWALGAKSGQILVTTLKPHNPISQLLSFTIMDMEQRINVLTFPDPKRIFQGLAASAQTSQLRITLSLPSEAEAAACPATAAGPPPTHTISFFPA